MSNITNDWETRFKQAYEEFNAEKEHICTEHHKQIGEMKQLHYKEIEAFAVRCAEKESQILGLKRRVRILEQQNCHLTDVANSMVEQVIAEDTPPECGYVELTNHTCYQDFIGILINNGYAVKIEPLNYGNNLGITILESEGK